MFLKILTFFCLTFITKIVKPNCTEFGVYTYLGVVNSVFNHSVSCQDEDEECIYAFFDIPDLVIGHFQTCSSKLNDIFNDFIDKRKDLQDTFSNSYCNTTDSYDINIYCQTCNAQSFENNSLSGYSKLYVNCFKQNGTIQYCQLPNYRERPTPVTPVTCGNETTCSEGYCGVYNKINYISSDGGFKRSIHEGVYCLNNVYNELYTDMNDNNLDSEFRLSLLSASKICASRSKGTDSNKGDSNKDSWYINCFIPTIDEKNTTSEIVILSDSVVESEPMHYHSLSSNLRNNPVSIFILIFFYFFFM